MFHRNIAEIMENASSEKKKPNNNNNIQCFTYIHFMLFRVSISPAGLILRNDLRIDTHIVGNEIISFE